MHGRQLPGAVNGRAARSTTGAEVKSVSLQLDWLATDAQERVPPGVGILETIGVSKKCPAPGAFASSFFDGFLV